MKKIFLTLLITLGFISATHAQESKGPGACKMYLDGAVVENIDVETALKWCDLVPPTVQCEDGKVYMLESFQISFFTLKPLMNKDFGLGERGVPIMARNAIAKGQPGDAIVLKEVKYTGEDGALHDLPVISLKLK